MPPKIFKPPEALNALFSTFTYSEDVVQPLNGHVIQLYVANDYNRRETARDILKKFRCEADELAVLNRLSTLIGRLITLRKSLSRNEVQIKSLLEVQFELSAASKQKHPSKSKKRPLDDPSKNDPGLSSYKFLKSDCDKCPCLRERLSELGAELREEKKRCRASLSEMKIRYNVRAVNRSKRQADETKAKLRREVADLKKENKALKKKTESLKDNIDGFPKLTEKLQRQVKATNNRNQFLLDEITKLKKQISSEQH